MKIKLITYLQLHFTPGSKKNVTLLLFYTVTHQIRNCKKCLKFSSFTVSGNLWASILFVTNAVVLYSTIF